MFHPESNPLAPKSTEPKKPEKELVEIWLGKEAAELMGEKEPDVGDENLSLTRNEKQKLWEAKRPDEVTLKNIPTWKELPDAETFKNEFKLKWIMDEYREGRPIEEFETQNVTEALPMAKVFDITYTIAKAKEKDPEHPNHLTMAEVLEAIDEAGYRPATLEELMAYARDHWKPDADLKTLTRAERELQNAQAPCIFGLNSVFSDADGYRRVPYLRRFDDERELRTHNLRDDCYAYFRFLVLRKASP